MGGMLASILLERAPRMQQKVRAVHGNTGLEPSLDSILALQHVHCPFHIYLWPHGIVHVALRAGHPA